MIAAIFLVLVAGLTAIGRLPIAVLVVYVVASAVTFIVYAQDKSAARKGDWRTSENTLHLLALTGGWPGALLGRQILRHKSRKQPFTSVLWGTVVLNCVALGCLLSPAGQKFLDSMLGAT